MAQAVSVFVLIPILAFISGVLSEMFSSGGNPATPSEHVTDAGGGIVITVMWFVQLALMGMSTTAGWLALLISVPASAFFYFSGTEVAEERRKTFKIVPFFETFVLLLVTAEEKKRRLVSLYRRLLLGVAVYTALVTLLLLLRRPDLAP